jgi:hypothetical protein
MNELYLLIKLHILRLYLQELQKHVSQVTPNALLVSDCIPYVGHAFVSFIHSNVMGHGD